MIRRISKNEKLGLVIEEKMKPPFSKAASKVVNAFDASVKRELLLFIFIESLPH